MSEPKGWHSRGYLPHYDTPCLVQTVTFRLADSLPAHVAKQVLDDPEGTSRFEILLDKGIGACWLRDPVVAGLMEAGLLHFDSQRYRLLAWCIMPNHVHTMVEMLDGHGLGAAVASWKQYVARMANRHLERSGPFWHVDYFDRFVRDEGHYQA
ncbi:MAG TPA: transposase, partial [Vineibacter sp.]|nr:transposase [Vineibacter sp.]